MQGLELAMGQVFVVASIWRRPELLTRSHVLLTSLLISWSITDEANVVAFVVGREDPMDMLTKHGKELKRLVTIVKDTEIDCALFDHHAEAILPYLDETREEPLIVVLHYFKATR
ncbi:hypothetical protein PIB30_042669 [Stylosanthes scabra]|uniref:Uncharacterized protein n=1 Tax=Stylosanthes scabra TaxID=79078 RepID=A0ABU6TEX8_9FABA|nr:hypothetical protein [Stylosanthes scabra]